MSQTAHAHTSIEAADTCPYCGHEVTHDEFLEIQARIAKEQEEKFNAERKQLDAQRVAETSELHKKLTAKDDAVQALLKSEHEKHAKALSDKDKAAAQQANAARKAERERVEKEHTESAAMLAKQREKIETAQKQLASDQEAQAEIHKEQLEQQRKALEADTDKKLRAQSAESEQSTHRLTKAVEDLKRQLERKSNDELGDGAEVILYDELKKAFPNDVITRVKKGVAGADIKHEVQVDGRNCGKIVYDSKNRKDWKTAYAEQLRKDQLAEKADHAILATRKFPASTREMTGVNGVFLINPARAVVLAAILRDSLIRLSTVKLSEQGKKDKQQQLYEFMTSARCENLFKRVADEVANLRQIDVDEKAQQEKVRVKRGKHVGEVEKTVLGDLQEQLHKILGI